MTREPYQLALCQYSMYALTQILNILVSKYCNGSLGRWCTRLNLSSECLKDDDSVCCDSSDESGSVAERGPLRVEVESYVGQAISEDAEEKSEMSYKPTE